MKAHEILFGARQYLLGLGVEIADDDQVWSELDEEQRRLVDAIIGVGNAGYPLPGDRWVGADVDSTATPWALEVRMWRFRRCMLQYSDGTATRTVRLVNEEQGRVTPPPVQPAAFVFQAAINGIGAAAAAMADRKWGWRNGERVLLLYVETPEAVTSADSTLAAPDDAKKYLMRYVGRFLACRRPDLGAETRGLLEADVNRARKELLEAVDRYGRTGYA